MGHSSDEHGSPSSQGALTIDKGYVTARVSTGAHMDAAIVDTLAGLELSVDTLAARFGDASPGFRGDRTISLAMTPDAMRELYELLGRKLGLRVDDGPTKQGHYCPVCANDPRIPDDMGHEEYDNAVDNGEIPRITAPLCNACKDAYANGIEPGEAACERGIPHGPATQLGRWDDEQ